MSAIEKEKPSMTDITADRIIERSTDPKGLTAAFATTADQPVTERSAEPEAFPDEVVDAIISGRCAQVGDRLQLAKDLRSARRQIAGFKMITA